MQDKTDNRTPVSVWIAAFSTAIAIACITFFVHRSVVESASEQGAGLREQRDSVRLASEEAEHLQHQMQGRKDTLTKLLSTLEEQLKSHPADSMLIISAANAAYDLEKFDVAERYYRQYIEKIDSKNNAVHIDLSFVIFQTGRKDEGIALLRGVLRRDPKNQMAMFNLAYMYEVSGKPELAQTWIKKCREVDPNSQLGQRAAAILQSK